MVVSDALIAACSRSVGTGGLCMTVLAAPSRGSWGGIQMEHLGSYVGFSVYLHVIKQCGMSYDTRRLRVLL
jgi:hypothetical protein